MSEEKKTYYTQGIDAGCVDNVNEMDFGGSLTEEMLLDAFSLPEGTAEAASLTTDEEWAGAGGIEARDKKQIDELAAIMEEKMFENLHGHLAVVLREQRITTSGERIHAMAVSLFKRLLADPVKPYVRE